MLDTARTMAAATSTAASASIGRGSERSLPIMHRPLGAVDMSAKRRSRNRLCAAESGAFAAAPGRAGGRTPGRPGGRTARRAVAMRGLGSVEGPHTYKGERAANLDPLV